MDFILCPPTGVNPRELLSRLVQHLCQPVGLVPKDSLPAGHKWSHALSHQNDNTEDTASFMGVCIPPGATRYR
eukprot:CAMPEP_0114272828 /NCGR_PEP_ID=MMETSP0058-20121206/28711_1 /TAXON_ID=36894 /ORGANISM="Pyramimonas parkeae, CCMP726" /LENGTH=72 /DNA_ID=CAMNT_0001392121 /DNA_START=1 /DNA_END=216 /DNA_ORIENTATION=-